MISSEVELTIFNSIFNRNQAILGGVVSAYHSIVTFHNSCSLYENIAVDGGALYATSDSVLNAHDQLQIWYNTGNHSGGGIYLYRSKLNCHYNGTLKPLGNRAVNKGAVLHTVLNLIFQRGCSQA